MSTQPFLTLPLQTVSLWILFPVPIACLPSVLPPPICLALLSEPWPFPSHLPSPLPGEIFLKCYSDSATLLPFTASWDSKINSKHCILMCRVLVPQLPPASVPSSPCTPRLKDRPNPYLPALPYRPWHKLFPGSDPHPPLCLTVSSSTLDPVQESHHPEASGQPGSPVPLLCNPIALILHYCLSLQGEVCAHSIWGGMHSNAWEKVRWEWKREQGLFYYLYLFWLDEALLWDKLCQPSGPPTPGQADGICT